MRGWDKVVTETVVPVNAVILYFGFYPDWFKWDRSFAVCGLHDPFVS